MLCMVLCMAGYKDINSNSEKQHGVTTVSIILAYIYPKINSGKTQDSFMEGQDIVTFSSEELTDRR